MAVCEWCDREFERGKYTPFQRFCSMQCRKAWAQADAQKRALESGFTCKQCGRAFKPKASDRRTFCSRDCAFAYKREHAKPKLEKPEAPKHYCTFCGAEVSQWAKVCSAQECQKQQRLKYYRRRKPEAKVVAPLVCAECGLEFLPEYGNKHRRYCSDVCMHKSVRRAGKQLRRARKKAVPREPIWIRKVYERDGWRCGICGKKVNPAFKSPHPMSVTLDHIIPIALGGSHTMGNVQCAHRSCNSRKGASGAGQLKIMECFT